MENKRKGVHCTSASYERIVENHIKGVGPALGIIPITEKNDCKWGCIIDGITLIISLLYLIFVIKFTSNSM